MASASHIDPRIESLLPMAEDPTHVAAIVITCGLQVVFEKVLERFNLHEVLKVVGGGRLADGYIVTPDLKSALVRRLQERYNIGVWAFGDSPLDLPMLKQADHAIFVVGDEQTRSRSMDVPLRHAIETDGLHAHQLLCPGNTSPRLNQKLLPIIRNEEIAAQFPCPRGMKILHASSRHAALLLSGPMRDASISGPALREAQRRLGCFLATELLSRVIGLEEYPIQHVQGHTTRGHRIRDEAKTCIVAIMRGGQPIAESVADALPRAMLLHANESEDVTPQYLEGLSAVVLVDAVINTGKSMVEFVHHIKHLCPKLRIAIVAGTVQQKAIGDHGTLTKPLSGYTGLSLAALRVSENSFAGTRGTDTGNRLFNTTHLE